MREKGSVCDKDKGRWRTVTKLPLTLIMHACYFLAPGSRGARFEGVVFKARGDIICEKLKICRNKYLFYENNVC